MSRKGKVISTLFKECNIDYQLLTNKKTVTTKSRVIIFRYMYLHTGDHFIAKEFENFHQYPKPAFPKNRYADHKKWKDFLNEVLIASKLRNHKYINKLVNAYVIEKLAYYTPVMLMEQA